MHDPEEIFGGDGDPGVAPYEELVTALAGGLYGELERLVGAHGSGAVSGLLPQLVSVLESLQGACGQVRERDQALERLRDDRLRLLEQYERERAARKRAEEVGREFGPLLGWLRFSRCVISSDAGPGAQRRATTSAPSGLQNWLEMRIARQANLGESAQGRG